MMDAFLMKKVWGEWLGSFQWDIFGTFTFRHPIGLKGAKKRFMRFMKRICPSAFYFFVQEPNSADRGVHIHTLAGNTDIAAPLKVMDAWNRYDGISRIVPYDAHKGASYYLAKNITSDRVDWEFVTNGVDLVKMGK